MNLPRSSLVGQFENKTSPLGLPSHFCAGLTGVTIVEGTSLTVASDVSLEML
jgi:hypothetical protein